MIPARKRRHFVKLHLQGYISSGMRLCLQKVIRTSKEKIRTLKRSGRENFCYR